MSVNNANIKNISDFNSLLNEIQPKIGVFGGRHFTKKNEGKIYRLNDIVRIFQRLAKGGELGESLDEVVEKINILDNSANQILAKKNILIRLFTHIRQFFGNIAFSRDEVLKNPKKNPTPAECRIASSYTVENPEINQRNEKELPNIHITTFLLESVENTSSNYSDEYLQDLINKISEFCFTPSPEKFKKGLVYVEDLKKILFYDNKSNKERVINLILSDKLGSPIVAELFRTDNGQFNECKQEVVNIINSKVSKNDGELYYIVKRFEGYLIQSKAGIYKRKTGLLGPRSNNVNSRFLEFPLFLDHEIISISRIKDEENLVSGKAFFVKKSVSENDKVVIQQAAIKSCGGTCVCMLLFDHNLDAPMEQVTAGHLTNTEQRLALLQEGSAKAFSTDITDVSSKNFLNILKKNIEKNGSAIVGIGGGTAEGRIGGHCVICDHISNDLNSVRLRDPWHGWEITVTAEAFLQTVEIKEGTFSVTLEQITV